MDEKLSRVVKTFTVAIQIPDHSGIQIVQGRPIVEWLEYQTENQMFLELFDSVTKPFSKY